MQDRSARTLVRLQESGSTSRLVNLVRCHNENLGNEAHAANPLFQSPNLNKALIVKHRLRPHERELFKEHRLSATKVILPVDTGDLRTGGRSAFIGQRGWDALLANLAGGQRHVEADGRTLGLLDTIPSFDPFLLREHLRRAGVCPAGTYFDISTADTERMFDFLQAQLGPLAQLLGGGRDEDPAASSSAIVRKLMSPAAEEAFAPLGQTLRLSADQYAEGVFCWKGFLYYRWRMQQHVTGLPRLVESLRTAAITGRADSAQKTAVAKAKMRVVAGLRSSSGAAGRLLKIYDDAFSLMVMAGDPTAFRDYLLDAPPMFLKLGDAIGAIDHVDGFWEFRFPNSEQVEAPVEDLLEILQDFEDTLGDADQPPALELAS